MNPEIECCHLKAVTLATSAKVVELQQEHLNQLVSIKLISEKTKERCLKMSYACQESLTPLVVLLTLGKKFTKTG